jgi:NitT/TauT family transport system substrate-binding protein
MRSNKFLKGLAITIVYSLIVASSSILSARAQAADEVKMGVLSAGSYHWPWYVADGKGFFKDEGLKVRKFQVRSVSKATQALSAGSTDILIPSNTSGSIRAQAKGAPVKIIAGGFDKALYDLIAGAKYKTVKDLKGATMGVINLTSGSTVLLKTILASNGMHYPKDFDMLMVGGTPQRFAAVKAGGVAAAMVTPPTSFMAHEAGLNIVANIGTYLPQYMFTNVGGNTDWMKKNRDTTVRFLKAVIRAHRFILDPKNKEQAIDILTKYAKVKRKYAAMTYKEVVNNLKPMTRNAVINTKALEAVIKLDVENKKLKKAFPASTFFDDSYWQEALKRLGG